MRKGEMIKDHTHIMEVNSYSMCRDVKGIVFSLFFVSILRYTSHISIFLIFNVFVAHILV